MQGRFIFFICGFICGVLVTFLYAYLANNSDQPDDGLPGLTLFQETGDCVTNKNEIGIFQVLKSNMALAKMGEYPDEIMVLIINYEGKSYYDEQKILIPDKKCARQIGFYQYTTNMGLSKTVPAVIIE